MSRTIELKVAILVKQPNCVLFSCELLVNLRTDNMFSSSLGMTEMTADFLQGLTVLDMWLPYL